MSLQEILESVKKMDVQEEAELLEFITKDYIQKIRIQSGYNLEIPDHRIEEAQSAYDYLEYEVDTNAIPSDDEINYYHNLALRSNESR